MTGPRTLVVAGALVCVCAVPAPAQELADTGIFSARLRTLAHLDWRRDAGGTSDLDVRRARLGVEGRVLQRVEYELVHDFRNSDAPWRDAYVNLRVTRALEVRGGRFKVPFCGEMLTGVADLTFINRSAAANYLAPARATGAMAHGRVFGRTTRYQAGLFTSGGDNTRRAERPNPDHGMLGGGRIEMRPFRRGTRSSVLAGLSLAAAATASRVREGDYSLAARTLRGDRLFPAVAVRGMRRRVGTELEWRSDRVQLAAEWMQVADQRLHQAVDDGRLSDVVGEGWHLSVTTPLIARAGEPRNPVVELAARLEQLAFGSRADGGALPGTVAHPRADVLPRSRNRAVTAGITWYARTHVKVQANLVRERRVDGATPGSPAWLAAVRLQYSL